MKNKESAAHFYVKLAFCLAHVQAYTPVGKAALSLNCLQLALFFVAREQLSG